MLDLEKEVVKVKFGGKLYEIEKPTNGMIREYNIAVKGLKDEELNDKFMELLKELGMPQELYDSLNPAQSKKVIEALYSTEKN